MWFGTDNGVARFDGYEFKTFGYAEGLGNPVVFEIFEDSIGNLCFTTMDGKLWIYDGEMIKPWRYNYKVDSIGFGARSAAVKFFDNNGWTTIVDQSRGLAHIHSSGQVIVPVKSRFSSFVASVLPNVAGGYIDGNSSSLTKEELEIDSFSVHAIFRTAYDSVLSYSSILDDPSLRGSTALQFHLVNDTAILCGFDSIYISKDVSFSNSREFKNSVQEIRSSSIGYLASCDYPAVVLRFDNVKTLFDGMSDTLVSNFRATDAISTLDGAIWAASVDNGVLCFPDLNQVDFSNLARLSGEYIQSFGFYEDELVLATRSGYVFGYNFTEKQVKEYLRDTANSFGAKLNGFIYVSSYSGRLYKGYNRYESRLDWHMPNYFHADGVKLPSFGTAKVKFEFKDTILLSGSHSIIILDLKQSIISNQSLLAQSMGRCFDIAPAICRGYFIGTKSGFAWQRTLTSEYVNLSCLHPSFNLRIQAIENVCGEFMAIGTKGLGVAVFTATDTVEIRKADGLTSDMIEDLYVDSECNVWVTTLSGLNKVTFTSLDSFKIQNFTIHHGLPSNEVTQVQEYKGEMWVATTKGLITLPEYEIDTFASKPMLVEVAVNDQEVEATSGLSFAHEENSLRLEWLTIDYQQMGRVPYRYRLSEGDDWTYTQDRSVTYPQLSPDSYEFEVQRANRDGIWSDSNRFSFTIKLPWWRTWWFLTLAVCSVLAVGIFIYKRRTGELKKSAEIDQKLVELERSALQAQMNPHFIFNCLASVQNYILSNDTERAVGYLSRFSRLVRQTLDASVEGQIFIGEEAQLLDNYLALEQQRFGEKFSYEVEVDPSLLSANARIPSMMVQPFVENAVIHGLAETNGAGRISVRYEKQEVRSVLVTISDNGPGISSTKESRARVGHKSVGMTITQKRLELMSKASDVRIIDLAEESSGKCTGTRVELYMVIGNLKKIKLI